MSDQEHKSKMPALGFQLSCGIFEPRASVLIILPQGRVMSPQGQEIRPLQWGQTEKTLIYKNFLLKEAGNQGYKDVLPKF